MGGGGRGLVGGGWGGPRADPGRLLMTLSNLSPPTDHDKEGRNETCTTPPSAGLTRARARAS